MWRFPSCERDAHNTSHTVSDIGADITTTARMRLPRRDNIIVSIRPGMIRFLPGAA